MYIPNPTDPTEPVDAEPAGTAAAEFRALKAYLLSAVIAASTAPTVRQSVQAAKLDSSGYNTAITTGAGLRPGLSATATPYHLSFAAGFANGKASDLGEVLSADIADIIGADLPVNNTSYLYRNYGSAFGSLLAPPQYGYVYDRTAQSVLQFAGAAGSTVFLDDYGNTWAALGGAKVQTDQFKFGTGGLGGAGAANSLNGAADALKSTNFTSMGNGGWSLRGWVRPTALPGAGNNTTVWAMSGAGTFGVLFSINNTAGTIRFTYYLSSDAATWNIASAVQGTTLPVINTWYFVELTFDALAGVYRLYVNGVQEQSTASSARICAITSANIGSQAGLGSFWPGYIDKPEFLPYCQHPSGTAYAVPTGTPAINVAGYSSDFFSIPQMKMFSPTAASVAAGTDPTLTSATRLYLGEADTTGVGISVIRNYAIRGQYVSALQTIALATPVSVNHNIGTSLCDTKLEGVVQQNSGIGFNQGDIIDIPMGIDFANGGGINLWRQNKNNIGYTPANFFALTIPTRNAGGLVHVPIADAKIRLYAKRSF